jgi:tRNA U34 5-carboxymethylaminomethyl modifying GTPase MnmE/TrmE
VLTRLAPVPRRTRMICALALAVGVVTLAACGSEEFDGSLSPEQSRALLEQVEAVEDSIEASDCTAAETDAAQLSGAIDGLPAEVGTELKGVLRDVTDKLQELVNEECEEPIEPTTTEEVDPVEPEIEEAPPEGDTETEPETPEDPEDDGDDGPGRGQGNGPPEDPGNSGGTDEPGDEG